MKKTRSNAFAAARLLFCAVFAAFALTARGAGTLSPQATPASAAVEVTATGICVPDLYPLPSRLFFKWLIDIEDR